MLFGWIALGCGAVALFCILAIYAEDYVDEKLYSNSKESGFRQDKQG